MLTLMFLAGVFLVIGLAVGVLVLLFKLVLLPFKLALGLVKLGVACTVGLVVLLLGVPLLVAVGLPLLLLGVLVWGMARLALA